MATGQRLEGLVDSGSRGVDFLSELKIGVIANMAHLGGLCKSLSKMMCVIS